MRARIVRMTEEKLDREALARAGEILRQGGLVAFPTETVYGLGGNALDPEASRKIYEAKGRPSDNPLIVHIADLEHLEPLVEKIPEKARILAKKCWPGPLTMIFSKSSLVPEATTGGLPSVAVRMPDHQVALELIRQAGGYVAAPSANTSGRPSPTEAAHVEADLGDRIDMIVDGGPVGIGLESTIVDFTEEVPTILRPGYLNQQMLEELIGQVRMDRGLTLEAGVRPKAPGMKYKHYAPKGDLTIVEGPGQRVVEEINRLAQEKCLQGFRVGIIAVEETAPSYTQGMVKCIGSRKDEESIARQLYRVLRDFDALEADYIYSEAFETPRMGQAIMNRLLKAAGHKIIKV